MFDGMLWGGVGEKKRRKYKIGGGTEDFRQSQTEQDRAGHAAVERFGGRNLG